jgi:hypothetical protein
VKPPLDSPGAPTNPAPTDADFTSLGWSAEQILEYKRNSLVGNYLKESDELCGDYLQALTRTQRSYSLILGSLATIFGGAGAAFTSASVVRPLSALASISSGERAEFDADTFVKQTAQVIISAIKNSRARTYNNIVQVNFLKPIAAWPLSIAIADVQDYHSRCSLNEGITEAAASITAVAPSSTPQVLQADKNSGTGIAGRSESPPSSIAATTATAVGAAQGVAATRGATPAQVVNAFSGGLSAAAAAVTGNTAPPTPPPSLVFEPSAPSPSPASQAMPAPTHRAAAAVNIPFAAAIARAQLALLKAGLKIGVDGQMGEETEAVLTQFQRTRSPPLPATGIVDPATMAALNIVSPPIVPAPAQAVSTMKVQNALLQSAYVKEIVPSFSATGLMDSLTVAALTVYQSSKGLQQTGVIDAPTLSSLGLNP